jgi:iron complex outermembrane receptor protein
MLLRFGMLLMIAYAGFNARAQVDSTWLEPVTIYGLPEEVYLAGSHTITLDSTLQQQQDSRHLGEILSFQLPIYFRNYGNGMSSGISMRGTSPQHVAVRWNGININSFSLGQADFSILHTVAFDAVKVHVGGGSARFGSGALGGSVLLSTGEDPKHPIMFSQEFGSFGRYFTSLKGSLHIRNVTSSTSLYRTQSKNNFPIPGSNHRQPHAAYLQQGIVQTLQFALSPSRRLKVNYWYHYADREIQPTIGNTTSQDTQRDQNHRLSFTYEQNNRFGLLSLSGGLVDDKIIYNGVVGEIFRWIGIASHQYTLPKKINLSVGVEWNHIIGKMPDYGPEQPVEDRIDVSASLQKNLDRLSLALSVRQPFIPRVSAPLLPYLGAEFDLIRKNPHQLKIRANGSRNFRAPTMNDRYWQDAGRDDLQPETSYAAEVGLDWRIHKTTLTASAFAQTIEEWIQWVPESNGVFRPVNIKKVGIKGMEIGVSSARSWGNLSASGTLNYALTHSITKETHASNQSEVGKQLIYTPVHTGSAILDSNYKTWSATLYFQFTGTRFTEAANSPVYALDPFALVDFSVGKSWSFQRHHLGVYAIVKNLLDTPYKLYSGRGMPGRNYTFKLTYKLNKKPHEPF